MKPLQGDTDVAREAKLFFYGFVSLLLGAVVGGIAIAAEVVLVAIAGVMLATFGIAMLGRALIP